MTLLNRKVHPPVWMQRSFTILMVEDQWKVCMDRKDVNTVLDHLETTASEEECDWLSCELGKFVLQQMMQFRHSHDVITLQEMAEEVWGSQSFDGDES